MVYDAQSDKDKRQYHARAVEIYGRNARKCNSCGAGAFLKVPGEDVSTRVRSGCSLINVPYSSSFPKLFQGENDTQSAGTLLARRRMIFADSRNRKKSFVAKRSGPSAARRRRESVSDTRRVSIMPTYLDHVNEDEGGRSR